MTLHESAVLTSMIVIGQGLGNVVHAAISSWLTNRSIRKMQAGMIKDAEEWARSHMAHKASSVGRGAN